MRAVLTLSGKASHVFKYLNLLARYSPNLTVGELARLADKKEEVKP